MAVYKRKWKSGETWIYQFDAPDSTKANRKQVFAGGFTTKRAAMDAEAARRVEVQCALSRKPGQTPGTLGSLLEEFFSEHGAKALAPKTLQRYREMAVYLEPALLALPLASVKPLHLSREWNRLLVSGGRHRKTKAVRPLSRKTVRNIAGMVSSAFTRGMRWGLVEVNPVTASEPPVPRKKEGIALTTQQQELLIQGANAPWGLAVLLELDAATGARRGELLGLQWSDLQDNRLMIGRSLSQVKQQVFLKEPKGKKFRTVVIPSSALKELNAHRQRQEEFRVHFGGAYQGDFIFANPDGTPLKPDSVSSMISLLFRRLKLPKGASLHTLRHSHGSHLLAAGVPLTDVSKRLGHANPHVTATVYAHAMPGHDDRAATAWEEYQKRPADEPTLRKLN